jgi:hypothetical protein
LRDLVRPGCRSLLGRMTKNFEKRQSRVFS